MEFPITLTSNSYVVPSGITQRNTPLEFKPHETPQSERLEGILTNVNGLASVHQLSTYIGITQPLSIPALPLFDAFGSRIPKPADRLVQ